ncbi:hypothetical protein NL676_003254 [Syzygium grande]|nr:hypothetical protein NL676_003254 [Syzygium grande]
MNQKETKKKFDYLILEASRRRGKRSDGRSSASQWQKGFKASLQNAEGSGRNGRGLASRQWKRLSVAVERGRFNVMPSMRV